MRAIHQAYVDAGAEVLLTNTFQANPATLARYGLDSQLVAIHCRAATLARTAAGQDRFVLADVGPIQRDTSGEEFTDRSLLRRSIRGLEGDGILLETCSTPRGVGPSRLSLLPVPGPVLSLPLANPASR